MERQLKIAMNDVKIGDYVLATKWTDGSPQDAWGVGFLSVVETKQKRERYMVVDSNDKIIRRRGFRAAEKITQEQGKWLTDNRDELEFSDQSLWQVLETNMREMK